MVCLSTVIVVRLVIVFQVLLHLPFPFVAAILLSVVKKDGIAGIIYAPPPSSSPSSLPPLSPNFGCPSPSISLLPSSPPPPPPPPPGQLHIEQVYQERDFQALAQLCNKELIWCNLQPLHAGRSVWRQDCKNSLHVPGASLGFLCDHFLVWLKPKLQAVGVLAHRMSVHFQLLYCVVHAGRLLSCCPMQHLISTQCA